jgi:predicted lipase
MNAPYCIEGLQNWTCVPCTDYSKNTSHVQFMGDFHKVFGVTAIHSPSQSIIISFRGTRNLDNWIHDLMFAKPDAPFPSAPPHAQVHYGFLKAYFEIRPEFLKQFLSLTEIYPHYFIKFLGHSLGGALALLAAIDVFTLHTLVIFTFFYY